MCSSQYTLRLLAVLIYFPAIYIATHAASYKTIRDRLTEGQTERQKIQTKGQTDKRINRQKDRKKKRTNRQKDIHINRELREITEGESLPPYIQS